MNNWESNHEILKQLSLLVNKYPQQRFCQILCNYVLKYHYINSSELENNIPVVQDFFYMENKEVLELINRKL